MARKGKPWGPSNPLWRWQHRHKRSARRSSGRRPSGSRRRTRRRGTQAAFRRDGRLKFMARRRYGRRGRHSFKIPVISTAILLGQLLLAHQRGGGSIEGTAAELAVLYTGYDLRNQGWNFA